MSPSNPNRKARSINQRIKNPKIYQSAVEMMQNNMGGSLNNIEQKNQPEPQNFVFSKMNSNQGGLSGQSTSSAGTFSNSSIQQQPKQSHDFSRQNTGGQYGSFQNQNQVNQANLQLAHNISNFNNVNNMPGMQPLKGPQGLQFLMQALAHKGPIGSSNFINQLELMERMDVDNSDDGSNSNNVDIESHLRVPQVFVEGRYLGVRMR